MTAALQINSIMLCSKYCTNRCNNRCSYCKMKSGVISGPLLHIRLCVQLLKSHFTTSHICQVSTK